MVKWLTSLALVLALAGGVLAGTPIHSGEHHCPMGGDDDCCAKAQSQDKTPEAYVARLCCSLNCTEQGATAPTGATNISPAPAPALSGAMPPSFFVEKLALERAYSTPSPSEHSPPIYIQHLALLI